MKIKNPELFIQKVRQHPYLYDPLHPDFRKNYEKNLAWSQIAKEFNMAGIKRARRKWRNLRDMYMSHKKGDKKYSNWPWRHLMTFLDGIVNFERSDVRRASPKAKPKTVDEMYYKCATTVTMSAESDPLSSSGEELELLSPSPTKKKHKYEREPSPIESVSEMFEELPTCSQSWQSDQEQTHKQPKKHQQQQQQQQSQLQQQQQQSDGINHLFQSYEETFRKFRPATQAMLKLELANLFAQNELNELQEQENEGSPTNSNGFEALT